MSPTRNEIVERLELAALTLKRLPNPAGSGARGYGNAWPEVVREAAQAYGYTDAKMRVIPSAAEISMMEESIGWLSLLPDPIDRHILWMRADNYRWSAITHRVGLVRQTCHRRAMAAVLTIERKLAKAAKARRTIAARPAP